MKYRRFSECEIRAAEDGGKHTIVGMPIVFNQATDIGPFEEIISRDALDDPAALRDVVLFAQHNADMIPMARSRNNNSNSTMRLTVTDEGVRMEADLDVENNADAAALYSAVKRGDLTGMSFAFATDACAWDWANKEHPTRTITKIARVFEVSAVANPAYPQTSISARSADDEALESARHALESEMAERKRKLDKLSLKIRLMENG